MEAKIEWCEEINHELIQRFWSYVTKTRDCWNWNGGLFSNGYGQFRVGTKKVKAHRFSWIINGGFLPDKYILLHKCDNSRCVRPDHLFLGTHRDNSFDRDRKGRAARNNLKPQKGEKNGAAKIDEATVKSIRHIREVYGFSFRTLALAFSISQSQIANIIHRRVWRHI